jgi:hypothetical protein
VQAAFHQCLRVALAAHGHGSLGGLCLGLGLDDRKCADVGADLCRQCLHGLFGSNESWLDQPGSRGFHRAAQSHLSERPNHRRRDGREILAARNELVKDVVIRRMADKWVNGNSFSQCCKIAHGLLLPAGRAISLLGLTQILSRARRELRVPSVTVRACVSACGTKPALSDASRSVSLAISSAFSDARIPAPLAAISGCSLALTRQEIQAYTRDYRASPQP